MNDIEIKTETQKFKYRVNGIIINDDKILTIKMSDNISYCLPGGHVELGENTKKAVLREMFEETGIKVLIDKEIAFMENFYIDKKGLKTHELSFYYIVTMENPSEDLLSNFERTEIDKGKSKIHKFEWIDINNLDKYDFRPKFIKEKLMDKNYDFEHVIKNEI